MERNPHQTPVLSPTSISVHQSLFVFFGPVLMLRSFWRTVDRFSLQHFKHIINELRGIKVVDKFNREAVVDILQSIVEIVSYGDKHDPSIFECFMELQALAEFVRMLKVTRNPRIQAAVLQYLSIMIQNLQSEQAIYYCFSNGYVNSIITHEYEFHAGDLALYYVSFLRTVSGKLSRDTVCLLVKTQEDAVTSFPLYTEAIRFAHHGEKMIQTAIRSLTLSIYNVSDGMVYRFLMTPPASDYFLDLFLKLREECIHLDTTICSLRDNDTNDKRKDLLSGIDKLLDDLYYIKDLLCVGRVGILSYIFSDNQGLLLASLMLLLVLAESDDLDNELASVFGFSQTKSESDDTAMSKLFEGSFLMQCMPQILNALLKLLQCAPSSLALTQWHAGWFLLKLIKLQRSSFNHQELHLFNIHIRLNVSFQLARECLLTELNGHWFDHIPDTFKKEWTSCKKALEESSRNKDPFFILQLAYHRSSSDGDEIDDWEKMVDAVKIFVLHVLLKAYVVKGSLPNDHLRTFGSSSLTSPRNSHSSDGSSANFGSLVPLGSGVACKIAFSKLGVRDIYMIPVAKGLSGKLLLVEKLSFQSHNGVVLAVAPLAGLTPKKDEKHATWLHLCIRDFSPKISGKRSNLNSSNHDNVAKWTLGFSDAGACEAARLLIYEETCKQRSFIESLLAPFLYDSYLNEEAD